MSKFKYSHYNPAHFTYIYIQFVIIAISNMLYHIYHTKIHDKRFLLSFVKKRESSSDSDILFQNISYVNPYSITYVHLYYLDNYQCKNINKVDKIFEGSFIN